MAFSPTIEKAGSADDAKTTECNLDKSNKNDPMGSTNASIIIGATEGLFYVSYVFFLCIETENSTK